MKRTLTALAALTVLATQAGAMVSSNDANIARDTLYGASVASTTGDRETVSLEGYVSGEDRTALGHETKTVSVTTFEGVGFSRVR